ncbi:carbohydrate ABC transporter permease [Rosettibacter firmus]|uniref:carbohydrate ABC transporter permease n=1 Tax=Rosettibacter firmus TaxID=3111522 RepID=UPI00336BD07A
MKKKFVPYLFVAPYIIHFLLFVGFPVGFSIYLTFHDWNIISPMEFIGLANYERLFNDTLFWKSLKNTLIFLLIHIPLQIIVALFLAELLTQKIKLKNFFRASYFMPVVVSGVVITILWQQLYGFESGLLNRLLTYIGIKKIGWLTDPNWAMPSIAIMATWKNVGLYIVLFLVGLQTIPQQYYEAAELEGATHLQKFFKITLPMINPTIFMVVILSTIGGFSLFIEPYVMTGGGPLNSTLSAVLYIYKQGFFYYHMGYAATLGFFFAFIILLVVFIQKKFVEREY